MKILLHTFPKVPGLTCSAELASTQHSL